MSNVTATLERYCYAPTATMGRLKLADHVWYTIEKPWANNQREISCIPEGLFLCKPYISRKFGNVYEVIGVPERDYILFHAGNVPSDIKGCIAVGKKPDDKEFRVLESREGLKEFLNAVKGFELFNLHVCHYELQYH